MKPSHNLFRTAWLLAGIPALISSSAQAQNTVTKTTWNGRVAFRLSDGKTEAVIVPELSSRVLSYSFAGEANILYNVPRTIIFKSDEWANWGGEKAWPALQSDWPLFAQGWPPHPTYDSKKHMAEMLPQGRLRTTGPVMIGFGVRAIREFSFDPTTGEFLITTTFVKETGEPRKVAVWNVTQVPQPDAIYLFANPNSAYRDGVYWFGPNMPKEAIKPDMTDEGLICYTPTAPGGYKMGTDTPLPSVASVKGDLAFVLRAEKKNEPYPEGAEGAGFPVTIWNNGGDNPATRYNEMEVMSPLTALKKGDKLVQTLRWRLVRLPNSDAKSPETRAAIVRALRGR